MGRWRFAVSRSRLITAIVAGLVATHITTVTGYWYPGIGLPKLDFNLFNGILLVPEEPALVQFVVGGVFHYLTGVSFAVIFAFLVHPYLPGPNSVIGNLVKALGFAAVLAVVSALWWVPVLFPAINAGFLTLNFGWTTLAAIFLWHGVYGIHLGALYSPLPAQEPVTEALPAQVAA